MRKLIALGIFGLLIASPVHAQAPAPAATPAPAASPADSSACQGTDKKQLRACYAQKVKDARKGLEQKITDACKRQGVKGTDLASCRVDMLTKAAAAIQ